MIDDPADRGEGKAKPPRFPPSKIEAAAARIRAALDEVGAGAGDLGLCGGASGGDLLFARACLERGMRIELHLARAENEFLAKSVTFADPDRRWERSFTQVTENPGSTVLVMPEELGPAPAGISVHDRCNRWMLYSALSQGLRRASFMRCGMASRATAQAERRTWSSWCTNSPGGSRSSSTLQLCKSLMD